MSDRTLRQWMSLPHFRQALHEAEVEVIGGALRKLGDLLGKSTDGLATLLDDEKATIRLQAIRIVLTAWPELKVKADLEARIVALEARANNAKRK